MNATLTFEEGSSRKFYSLTLAQKSVTIQFGRLGTAGQTQVKTLDSEFAARKLYDSLLAEKRKKGYVDQGAAAPAAQADAGDAPAAKKGKPGKSAKAAEPPVVEAPAVRLPAPSLVDPPVPGLDLEVWRKAEVPVPERDSTPFTEGAFIVEGYAVTVGDDGELVVTDSRGKKLKNPPDKLRKHEDYQALMRGRKDDRARVARARRVLEERMISGASLAGDELAWLLEDDAFAPLLRGALLRPVDRPRDAGLLLGWDAARGLGLLPADYDARWLGWSTVEVVHPMKLGEVTPWQDLLIDVGMQQELVQVFREVKNVPTAQRNLTESLHAGGAGDALGLGDRAGADGGGLGVAARHGPAQAVRAHRRRRAVGGSLVRLRRVLHARRAHLHGRVRLRERRHRQADEVQRGAAGAAERGRPQPGAVPGPGRREEGRRGRGGGRG